MTVKELLEKIDGVEFEGMGIDVEEDKSSSLVIRHTGSGLLTRVPTKTLAQIRWEELHPILTGQREGSALKHMTRVVGYFSQTSNWNQSKLGELKDRHKGNYGVAEAGASA